MKNKIRYVCLFIIYTLLAAGGMVLFKSGSGHPGIQMDASLLMVQIPYQTIFGALLYLLSFFLWLGIISKSALTLAYPVSIAVINILVLILSVSILDESFSLVKVTGMTIAVVGVILISSGDGGQGAT